MNNSLSDPISDELPCGPDLEYDPEYLLLFTRAAPRAEAQYGDFISAPETINWSELERDARRLLLRSKDIRILIILLRCRIQQAGAQGLAEALTLLDDLCSTYPEDIHPQLLPTEDISAEDALIARSNALSALLDHEGVMADIRSIILSKSAAMRLQVRDVERALSLSRPADALSSESVRQQLSDLEARGELPLKAFTLAAESVERIQRQANEKLHDFAPDLSSLKQLLMLLPGVVQTTTPELVPTEINTDAPNEENKSAAPEDSVTHLVSAPTDIPLNVNAEVQTIRNRIDALEQLRVIRRWFESNEPSSPTVPLLRQAERLVGKRFSEVINEIPQELLEKWDAMD